MLTDTTTVLLKYTAISTKGLDLYTVALQLHKYLWTVWGGTHLINCWSIGYDGITRQISTIISGVDRTAY